MMDLIGHLYRQKAWSELTFGPGKRTKGLIDHIKKELVEIETTDDVWEWIDVIILALDGAWRDGLTPEQIAYGIQRKQIINENRKWPDWRKVPEDVAVEHIRD